MGIQSPPSQTLSCLRCKFAAYLRSYFVGSLAQLSMAPHSQQWPRPELYCAFSDLSHDVGQRHGIRLQSLDGSRIPTAETASLTLRCDRIDKESSEVTYVSTDNVRVTGAVDFEVFEKEDLILCGSLERMESSSKNGGVGFNQHHHQPLDNDSKTGWSMDCYSAASLTTGSFAFCQPKLGISSPSIKVYVTGCCSGFPLILMKTIHLSPRRKPLRQTTLDFIPEDEETGREYRSINGFLRNPERERETR
ncbi:uncharacterized protein At1g01500-like [Magnolia sinica]|uniref:uncharacterized protein At1g01500-like n=1 Tax=Magnolia sinica TaxID=86752 RepID=UPI00265856F8|nr:uncharacterized protein At1g01500-like [Magnolia sinica]